MRVQNSRGRRLAFALLAVSLGLGASLVALELGLRATTRPDTPPGFTLKDAARRYKLRPGFRGRTYDALLSIDSRGARGPERALDLRPETLRIAVVGDSLAFGIGVADAETFPALLEDALARALPRPVQVFNLGVPGYNTVDEALYLEEVFDTYRPDLVVLQYTQGNDAFVEPRPPVRTGLRSSRAWQALRELPPSSYVFTWTVRQVRRGHYLWTAQGQSDDPEQSFERELARLEASFAPDSPGWLASREALARMAGFCAGRGVPLVLVLYADANHLTAARRARLAPIAERITRAAHEAGIARVIPLEPAFVPYEGREVELRVRFDDGHWSALANRLVASEVAASLLREPAVLSAHGPR